MEIVNVCNEILMSRVQMAGCFVFFSFSLIMLIVRDEIHLIISVFFFVKRAKE